MVTDSQNQGSDAPAINDTDDGNNDNDSALIARIQSEGVKRAEDCLAVCDEMVRENGKSMRQACKIVGIGQAYFQRLTKRSQTLRRHYVHAREAMIETKIDELIDIDLQDFPTLDDGRIDPAAVQVERMRRDDAKWLISKVLPKTYGDKLELNGGLEHNHRVQRIERVIVDKAVAAKNAETIDVETDEIVDSGQNGGQVG